MSWSTNRVAQLAGTTPKAVRYYHRIGLLEEPSRAANGYKRYRVRHLIRLLRIRRLVDLGVPLSGVAAMEASDDDADRTLRTLDAELAASIERQQRMRKELAAVLADRSLVDLPPGFDDLGIDLRDADRALLVACSSILNDEGMALLHRLHSVPKQRSDNDFDALPADASDAERQALAERMLPDTRRIQQENPALRDLVTLSRRDERTTQSVVVQWLVEYYNPAQLDVLRRLHALLESTVSGE